MSRPQIPVIVVGAGPAGLTSALLLAHQSVPVVCIDRRADVSTLPRARGVHARAMEILQPCGVVPDLRHQGLDIAAGAEWRRDLLSPPLRSAVTGGPTLAEVSPQEGLAIAQDVFEQVLRTHLAAHPLAQLRTGVTLESFTQRADGVECVVLDAASGLRSTIHTPYLIGADGWRSSIRDSLGIGVSGPDDMGTMRAITFRADLTPWTSARPRGMYFLTGAMSVLFSTHPDHRWVVNLPITPTTDPHESPRDAVQRALGGVDTDLEILTDSQWTAAAQNASHFSCGRTFLVGDAAHRVPPAGATGVSSALADAHNLAWKLAAVLHGWADETLLASYAVEREAVAATTTEEARLAWIAMSSPDGEPFTGRSLRQLDMGYQYRSSAVAPDNGPSTDLPGDYEPTAAPGSRAPHLWLSTNENPTSTIDLFDRGLTLLTGSEGQLWADAVTDVATSTNVPVTCHVIDHPAWPRLYGVTSTGAVLVRPDGHVAWRSTGRPPETSVGAALSAAANVLATVLDGMTRPIPQDPPASYTSTTR